MIAIEAVITTNLLLSLAMFLVGFAGGYIIGKTVS